MIIYMYTGPGQGQAPLMGVIYFKNINLPSICSFAAIAFFKSNDCVTDFISQYKGIGKTILPFPYIGRGQSRVIIYLNFVNHKSMMLHAKFQYHRSLGSE